jgi:broad specificity phosphatase PhoE
MKHYIAFESHSTSIDNECGIASGSLDPVLSEKGKKQAQELGHRYRRCEIQVVYCSDLQRSIQTSEIAFGSKKIPIIQDPRLREWDYGEYNGYSQESLEQMKVSHIQNPFPGGESLLDAHRRICDFLQTISDQRVVLVGHRATYYTLEHLSANISFEKLVRTPWHWQPGWKYPITILRTNRIFSAH